MSGWATDLVEALGIRAEQIGLRADMPGDEFETALGSFLAFEKALPVVGKFGYVGTPGAPQMGVDSNFQAWFNTANGAVQEVRHALWHNLFVTYGRDQIDDVAATTQYDALHAALRVADGSGPESWIAHATTNYDTAIETALGSKAKDGFVERSGQGSPVYAPDTLTSGWESTAEIPVVHLHGAVGWYYRQDGSITRLPADENYDDRRAPALLLPDDTKGVDTFTKPQVETWGQFRRLLQMSTHVVFIGHSLHDAHIVDAVVERDLSVCVIAHGKRDSTGTLPRPADSKVSQVRSYIPKAFVVMGELEGKNTTQPFDTNEVGKWMISTTSL